MYDAHTFHALAFPTSSHGLRFFPWSTQVVDEHEHALYRMLKSSRNNYFLSMFEPAVSNLQRCPVPVAQDSSIRGHSRDVSKSDCRVDG